MKVSDKPFRMHASVGTGAAVDPDRRTFDVGEGFLDDLLDAQGVILVLPARVGGAVVGDDDFVLAFHDDQ